MYKNKKILALITARGGSKGIPGKNIKNLGGKPLISWTIEVAKSSKYLDRLILSSDSSEIIDVALSCGCEVPFVRPSELATDQSSSIDVVLHAINSLDTKYDYILLLQPTSPFRKSSDIDGIIEYVIDNNLELAISVSKVKKHPAYLYKISGKKLIPYIDVTHQLRRQDMPSTYEHNGALYFSSTEYILKEKTYNNPLASPYEMVGKVNIDIDDVDDWEYAEFLINRGMI